MIPEDPIVAVVQVLFLGCIGLCFWKRLWIALAVLVAVIVGANAIFFTGGSLVTALLVSLGGTFIAFPIAVYFNLEGRERQDRRKTIRRSRRRTGRDE